MQKAAIPTVGTLIRFLDTEGNDVGAMHYEIEPHTRAGGWQRLKPLPDSRD